MFIRPQWFVSGGYRSNSGGYAVSYDRKQFAFVYLKYFMFDRCKGCYNLEQTKFVLQGVMD